MTPFLDYSTTPIIFRQIDKPAVKSGQPAPDTASGMADSGHTVGRGLAFAGLERGWTVRTVQCRQRAVL
jgi:hypothetical protein